MYDNIYVNYNIKKFLIELVIAKKLQIIKEEKKYSISIIFEKRENNSIINFLKNNKFGSNDFLKKFGRFPSYAEMRDIWDN